jgi:hypothetical protein
MFFNLRDINIFFRSLPSKIFFHQEKLVKCGGGILVPSSKISVPDSLLAQMNSEVEINSAFTIVTTFASSFKIMEEFFTASCRR